MKLKAEINTTHVASQKTEVRSCQKKIETNGDIYLHICIVFIFIFDNNLTNLSVSLCWNGDLQSVKWTSSMLSYSFFSVSDAIILNWTVNLVVFMFISILFITCICCWFIACYVCYLHCICRSFVLQFKFFCLHVKLSLVQGWDFFCAVFIASF